MTRNQIGLAVQLLAWLHARGLTVQELTQPHLEAWITEGSANRSKVRVFVAWTAARRLTPELVVTYRRAESPSRFLDENHHLELLRQCLGSDDSMPTEIKVAGGLVLLYGLRVAKIHALTTGQVTTTDRGAFIELGAVPVLLPPSLGKHIAELIAHPPRHGSLGTPAGDGPTYLFPGLPPSRPMSPDGLTDALRRYGIAAGAGRNTALLALAADLPAAVIADLFGMHHQTASSWSAYARADWTAYLNSRPAAGSG